jgi:hypothetical protein
MDIYTPLTDAFSTCLLALEPAATPDEIARWRLVETPLDAPPAYTALSYT